VRRVGDSIQGQGLKQKSFKVIVKENSPLIQVVSQISQLSSELSIRLVEMGAVWRLDAKLINRTRLRDPNQVIKSGEAIGVFIDENLISAPAVENPFPIQKTKDFEVWYKPVGWVCEGSLYGDHLSMERFASGGGRAVHSVNRLDREVEGLMVLGPSGESFAKVQSSWGKWTKIYQAEVYGHIEAQEIALTLDGKPSKTVITRTRHLEHTSLIELQIFSGRFHQIRRHLDAVSHPVMGDPKYGRRNKDSRGLMLRCVELSYLDAIFQAPIERRLF
jgi:tRNA pseudouridine32 synthase/23S rRNA pseudouridine746 synthase